MREEEYWRFIEEETAAELPYENRSIRREPTAFGKR